MSKRGGQDEERQKKKNWRGSKEEKGWGKVSNVFRK